MSGVNVKLEQTQNFDASIKDKKILGIYVLSSSTRRKVQDAHDDTEKMNRNLEGAFQDNVDYAVDTQEDCEAQEVEATSDSDDSETQETESQKGDVSTQDYVDSLDVDSETLEENTITMADLNEILVALQEDNTDASKDSIKNIEENDKKTEDANNEIESLTAEAERLQNESSLSSPSSTPSANSALAKPMSAPMDFGPESDGMGGVVDSAFDGTGSGTNSAYSLSTATETEEDNKAIASGEKAAPATPAASPAPVATPMAPAAAPTGSTTGTNPYSNNKSHEISDELKSIREKTEAKRAVLEDANKNIENERASVEARDSENTEIMDNAAETTEEMQEQVEETNERHTVVEAGIQAIYDTGEMTMTAGKMAIATGTALQAGAYAYAGIATVLGKNSVTTAATGAKVAAATANPVTAVPGGVAAAGLASASLVQQGSSISAMAQSTSLYSTGLECQGIGLDGVIVGGATKVGALGAFATLDAVRGDWSRFGEDMLGIAKTSVEVGVAVVQTCGAELSQISAVGKGIVTGVKIADASMKTIDAAIKGDVLGVVASAAGGASVAIGGNLSGLQKGLQYTAQGANVVKNVQDGDYISAGFGAAAIGLDATGTYGGAGMKNIANKTKDVLNVAKTGIDSAVSFSNGDIIGGITNGSAAAFGTAGLVGGDNKTTNVLRNTFYAMTATGEAVGQTINAVNTYKDGIETIKGLKTFGGQKGSDNASETTTKSTTEQAQETSTEDTGFTEAELAALSAKYGRRR